MSEPEVVIATTRYFTQYYRPMLRRAMKYVHNLQEAEDVVSDCWIKLIQQVSKLIEMDEPARSTYIMKSVQNEALDHIRHQKKHGYLELADEYAAITNLDQIVASNEYVHELLRLLPPHERRTMQMHIQGFSTSEIATQCRLTQSSVRVYKLRAQRRLIDYIHAIESIENL